VPSGEMTRTQCLRKAQVASWSIERGFKTNGLSWGIEEQQRALAGSVWAEMALHSLQGRELK